MCFYMFKHYISINTFKMSVIRQITPLSGIPWPTQDPFLFCAYHLDHYPAGQDHLGPAPGLLAGRNLGHDFTLKDGWRMYHGTTVPGFPVHPHRGFETITINKQGWVDHSDSLGAAGRFGPGDVQWMTAGRGVQHAEMFPLLKKDKDNPLEIFQVWLNLPRADKFVEPHYKMLWHNTVPQIEEEQDNGQKTIIRLIAGTYKDFISPEPPENSWAADQQNQVMICLTTLPASSHWQLSATDADINRTLYFYSGQALTIDQKNIPVNSAIELVPDRTLHVFNPTRKPVELLLLQGRPINEPVVQYGPFVMNSKEEIHRAFVDYQRTEYGGWPWPQPDPVHGRQRGRFARYADGCEEVPDSETVKP